MAKLKPYTKYKDSGSSWIGSIPDHWDIKPLRAMLNQRNEKNDPIITEQILSLSIANGVTLYSHEGRGGNKAKSDLSAYKIAHKDDIVLNSMNVIVGAVGLSEYTGAISPVYYALYSNKKDVNIKYYEKIFKSKAFQKFLMIYGKGILIKKSDSGKLNTIRMKIPPNDLKTTILPYPPIQEQEIIEQYLNTKSREIDKYVKKLKKEIALLKEHRQKIISQAVTCGLDENGKLRKKPEWNDGDPMPKGWKDSGVEWLGLIPDGWEIRKLKYISKINKDALPESTSAEFNIDYVDISSVSRTKGIMKTEAFQFSKAPSRARRIVHDGDVIVSTVRTYLKAIAGIENPPPNLIVSTGFAVLTPNFSQIDSRYFKYSLIGDYFVDNVVRNSVGVSYPAINTTRLGSIIVIFPNLKNQTTISKYLDENVQLIDKHVDEIENQIEIIKEYKQSLISKVVTGKIDVRNINNNLSED